MSKRLEGAIEELQKQTPPPMNTMLDKQSREEAIAKKKARDSMTMVDVLPTNPGNNTNIKSANHDILKIHILYSTTNVSFCSSSSTN